MQTTKNTYEVNVGNIGNITCDDITEAVGIYTNYVNKSKEGIGRAANENVCIMLNGQPLMPYEYFAPDNEDNNDLPDENEIPENAVCLIDGNRGIYAPQQFMETYGNSLTFTGMTAQEIEDCKKDIADPESEFYYESFEAVLNNATLSLNGITYSLTQDGDIFGIPVKTEKPISPAMATVLNGLIQIEDINTLRTMYRTGDYSLYSEAEMNAEWERRADLQKQAEAKKLKPVDKLQFILKNNPDEFKYDIDDLFKKSFCQALTKHLPYTHFSHDQNYILKTFKVDYEAPIKDNAKRFEDFVKSLGVTIANFKVYAYVSSTFQSYYFRRQDKPNTYSLSVNGNDALCHLIQYLVTGEMRENYSVAMDFLKANKVGYDTAAYKYTIGNIGVQRYGNGKLVIMGMTTAQEKIVNTLFVTDEKLKRR